MNEGVCSTKTIRYVWEVGVEQLIKVTQLRTWTREAKLCNTGRLHFRYPHFTSQLQNDEIQRSKYWKEHK